MAKSSNDKIAGISSDAVKAKTGKAWPDWFKLLDKEGAAEMPHKEIAALLHEKHSCPPWWSQMVTVAYEQSRGLRVKLQTHAGDFSGSASRTIATPIAPAFKAWMDAKTRARWLPKAKFTVSKSTTNRSIRMVWAKDETRVEVMFYAKGADKCQVTVQHSKLKNAAAAKTMKAYWSDALARLKGLLES